MPLRAILAAAAPWLLLACSPGPDAPAAETDGAPVAERVVALEGSCRAARVIDAQGIALAPARPAGDLARYHTPLVVVGDERVRVRANAMWPADDLRNVIGTISAGVRLLGDGPLKDSEVSAGVGYAIAVADSSGRRCRGYVSLLVARPR